MNKCIHNLNCRLYRFYLIIVLIENKRNCESNYYYITLFQKL